MYEALLESLKYYAEHGLGQISTYEASRIVDLLQDQHTEIAMLRKMQPVVLEGKSAENFVNALELSEIQEQVKSLTAENFALKAYKDYFTDMYGEGYEVANYHLNGDLEPFDNFLDGAEAEYNNKISKEN